MSRGNSTRDRQQKFADDGVEGGEGRRNDAAADDVDESREPSCLCQP
jgi:hypothetical protein